MLPTKGFRFIKQAISHEFQDTNQKEGCPAQEKEH